MLVARAIFPEVIARLEAHFSVTSNQADTLWNRAEFSAQLAGKVGVFTTGGERIDAAEAERIGLINKCIPADQLDAEVNKLAHSIANNAPMSVLTMKRGVNEVMKPDGDRAMIDAAVAACFDTEDYREGRTAFMEKRKPVWKGR